MQTPFATALSRSQCLCVWRRGSCGSRVKRGPSQFTSQLFTFPNIVSRRVASSSCVALPNTTTHKLIPPSPPPVTHCSYSTAMAAVALSLPPLRAAACEGSSAPSFAVGQQQHQGYPATRLAGSQFAERMIEKLQDMKAPLVSSTDDPKGCCALVDGTARM